MKIVRAQIQDAELILHLQKLAYESEAAIYNDRTLPPLQQTLDEIKAEFATHYFLKAIAAEKIAGSVRACIKNNTCYLGRLIVHPAYQNQGIGTALMNEIEQHYSSVKRFELFTGAKSEKNIRLYQKLGYKIYKTEEVNDRLTLVYLEKVAT